MDGKIISEGNNPKVLVDLDEYEDDNHQTYRYLYDNLQKKFDQLQADIKKKEEEQYNAYDILQDRERELSQVKDELACQKDLNEKLRGTADTLREFVDKFMSQEITVVKDIKAIDSSSGKEIVCNSDKQRGIKKLEGDTPGIYYGHRPSWFTPLGDELNKENAAKKTADNTKTMLKDRLLFWKTTNKRIKEDDVTVKDAAAEYDTLRKQKISDLLRDNCSSNEEKYIKYMLLTPGMPKEFLQTFTGAAELGLDANVIIELLEQPNDLYNQEIIEIYVSEVHKGTEYNLKKELAEELVRGEWYVRAKVNGKDEKLQLVPFEMIDELKRKLDNISKILLNVSNDVNGENREPDETAMNDIQRNDDVPVMGKEESVDFDAFLND